MSTPPALPGRLVLSNGSIDPEAGRASGLFSAAAPLVLGLVAPIALMLLIDPSALRHTQFLLVTILLPLLVVAVAIYAYSVLNPGDVAGVVADRERRVIEVVQANVFATRRTAVPFAEVAQVRLGQHYDQDGYATERAELVLESGDRVPLPAGTGAAEVSALKAVLGRG